MQYSIIAAGLVGIATAAYAPSYGSEETSAAVSAPAYEPTNSVAAPVYESTSSVAAPAETSAPAGYGSDTTVTDVVSEFTTYCPEATTLTHQGSTYTVSEATTLTITSCAGGCTKETESATVPAYSPVSPVESTPASVPAYAPSSSAPAYVPSSAAASTPVAPVESSAPAYSASTPVSPVETTPVSAPAYSAAPTATWATSAAPYYPTGAGNETVPATGSVPSASSTYPATYTGAASKAAAGAMVGVSGLLAALFL